jgi:GAF domain-containing protein
MSRAVFGQELVAVEYLQRKFRMYSRFLFKSNANDADIASIFQIQRVAPFIRATAARLGKIFNCRAAEIWVLEKDRCEIRHYQPQSNVPLPVSLSESGIAGYALQHFCSVSLATVNNHAAYHASVDGPPDQSVFALPVSDADESLVYAVVLRGKHQPFFFTDTDEKSLVTLAPLVIASLKACESIERGIAAMEDMNHARARLQSLLESAEILSGQTHLPRLIPVIMKRACKLVGADRCELLILNDNRDRMIAWDHTGTRQEISAVSGIVGIAASASQRINIKDAQEDPRIDHTNDQRTGYRTHTILCIPIVNRDGLVQGVTQIVNKIGGVFTSEDEQVIELFNVFVGIAIQNALSFEAPLDLAVEVAGDIRLEAVLCQTRKVIQAGRAMLFTVQGCGNYDVLAIDEGTEARRERIDRVNKSALNGLHNPKKALVHKMLNSIPRDQFDMERAAKEDRERFELVYEVARAREVVIRNSDDNPEDSMVAAPVIERGFVVAVVLIQWRNRESTFVPSDCVLLEKMVGFVKLALKKHPAHVICLDAMREMETRQFLSDEERPSFSSPNGLKMEKGEGALLFSKNFRIEDFTEVDGNCIKIPFHLLRRLGTRKKWLFTNEVFLRFVLEVKEASGEHWLQALESSCHLAHLLVNANLLTLIRPLEMLALFITVLSHRIESPSFTDGYVPEGLQALLNKQSLAGSHTCLTLMKIMTKPACNLLAKFAHDDVVSTWNLIIELILSLNWAQALNLVAEIETTDLVHQWPASSHSRLAVMKLILKASTMMKAIQSRSSADSWADDVLQRDKLQLFAADVKEDKAAFFRYICEPLFELLARLFPPLGSPFSYQLGFNNSDSAVTARETESALHSPTQQLPPLP